ncbi:hypothetical protein HID58_071594 [Brassica napus]|uniref:DYW domain-containing protein n=1 Tax=Brassica napus TaxID=3708 RepID=A0ABQ7Z203_BRANA|nr:hypothetical protein HID58_071594 [Brassica napus]
MPHSQGQESCREYISGTEICQAKQCDDQCTVEYNGYGKCLAGTNLMLGDLSKFGRIKEARQLFDRMPDRDKFTWNTMIVGYSSSRRLADAKQILLRNPMKNSIPWSALISGNGLAYKAIECFRDVRREGNQPNQFIFPSVLTACAAVSARWIGVQRNHGFTFEGMIEKDAMSEDRRHPRMVEIYSISKVDETMLLIKEAGRQGAFGLAYHSVKLAVLFGQLAVPSGAPIRIIKNLRILTAFITLEMETVLVETIGKHFAYKKRQTRKILHFLSATMESTKLQT